MQAQFTCCLQPSYAAAFRATDAALLMQPNSSNAVQSTCNSHFCRCILHSHVAFVACPRKEKKRKCQIRAIMPNGSASLSTLCRTDLLGQIKAVHNPRMRHILSLNLTLYAAKNSKSVSLCVCYSTEEKGNVHNNMVQNAHRVFVTALRKKKTCITTWFTRPVYMSGPCRHCFKIRLMQVQ